MLPPLPMNSAPNGIDGNAVLFGEAYLGCAGSVSDSNLTNRFFIEDGGVVSAPFGGIGVHALPLKDAEAMNDILTRGYDFKIGNSVVTFDPVNVIDMHPSGDEADEGFGNKAVYFLDYGSPLAGYPKRDDLIAILVQGELPKVSTYADDVAEIGNAIAGKAAQFVPLFHIGTSGYYPDCHIAFKD